MEHTLTTGEQKETLRAGTDVLGGEVVTPQAVESIDAAANMKALESSAVSATFWTVLDYGAGHALRVVNSLVLTRLLVPSAFGEMGLVMTLIVGMTLLSDIGLEPSIVQSKRGDDPVFLDTAWTLQAIRGAILWLASLLLAYPAARFYHDPQLLQLLPVLAFISIITGLNSTRLLTLSRHMGVKRIFALDFSTQIVALVVTVTWAYLHPSVWALVAGSVVSNVYRLALSHWQFSVPGRGNSFRLDREAAREILHFGKWIILGTAFFFFASQADRLVLGRLVTMTTLGVYTIAFQISDVPRSVINAFSNRVGLPFAAKLTHLPDTEFRQRFLRYRRYVLLGGIAMLSTMVAWGGWVVARVYPARYDDAVWMIPILSVGLWHTLLYNTTSPALLAKGISTYNAGGNALYCATMLIGIPVGFHWFGLIGALVAIAAGDLPLYIVTQTGAVRNGIRPLLQDVWTTCAFAVAVLLQIGVRRMF